MIKKIKSLNCDNAIDQYQFQRDWNQDWLDLCLQASEWLKLRLSEKTYGECLYVLYSTSFINDNRITRYYGFKKKRHYNSFAEFGGEALREHYFEHNGQLLFYNLAKLDLDKMHHVIDWLRDNRDNFLVISNSIDQAESALKEIVDMKCKDEDIQIDYAYVVERLLELGVHPVRFFGQFDDRELSVEIY